MAAEQRRDFDSWTSLISQLEQSSPDDIVRLSEAYDAFLLSFPLCYGYWKRYAEHKARLGSVEAAVEVYERGVEAAPYSVHLWDCYCGFAMLVFEDVDDVRRLFERGLSFVGKDYLCHVLWDKYLQLEYSQKQWNRLGYLYIRVLSFPTKKLDIYYSSFEKLVATMNEEGFATEESSTKTGLNIEDLSVSTVIDPPDRQELLCVINDLMSPMVGPLSPDTLKKYISAGQYFYQKARRIHANIMCFENRIRRPYFHVKPIDDTQLDNWHQYLDFVLIQEDFDWTVKLHERCLIPCANYPEFWIRYVEYMERVGGREMADYALVRATSVILKDIPEINVFSSRVKELRGDDNGARAAYRRCDSELGPCFLENIKRKANMEKRMGNMEAATDVYKNALKILNSGFDIAIVSGIYVDFCRFTYTLKRDPDAARDVLVDGINHFPHCKVLLEELMRFELMHGSARNIDLIGSIITRALDSTESMSKTDRENISRTYLELVDQFGSIDDLNKAWTRHLKLFPHLLRRNHEELVCSDSLISIRYKGEENGGTQHHHVNHVPEGTGREASPSEPPEIRKYLPQLDGENGTNESVHEQEDNCEIDMNESHSKADELALAICTIYQPAMCPEEFKPSEEQLIQDEQLPQLQKYLSQLEVQNGTNDSVHEQEVNCELDTDESHAKVHESVEALHSLSQAAKNDSVHEQEVNCKLDTHESHAKILESAEAMYSLSQAAEFRGESKSPEQLHIQQDQLPEVQTYLPQLEVENGTKDTVYEQKDNCELDMHEFHVKVHELTQAICTISQAEVSKPPQQVQRQRDQLPEVQSYLPRLEVQIGANDSVYEQDDDGDQEMHETQVKVHKLAHAFGANESVNEQQQRQQDQLPEVQNYLPQLEVQIAANDIVDGQKDNGDLEMHESHVQVYGLAQAVSTIFQAGDCAVEFNISKQQERHPDQLPEAKSCLPQLEVQIGTNDSVCGQEDDGDLDMHESHAKVHGLAQAICTISQAANSAEEVNLPKQQQRQQDQLPEIQKYLPQLEAQHGTFEGVCGQEDNCKLEFEPTNQQHGQQGQLPNDLEPPPIESLSINSEFDGNNISVATVAESGVLVSNVLTLSETENLKGTSSQNEISQICGTSCEGSNESILQRKADVKLKAAQAISLLGNSNDEKEQKIWEQIEVLQKKGAQTCQRETVHRKNSRQRPEGGPRQRRRFSKGSNMMWDQALHHEPAQFRQTSKSQHASQAENYYQPSSNSFHPGYQMYSSLQNSQLQDSSSSFQFPPVTQMHVFSNQSPMPDSGSCSLDQYAQEYNMQMWQYYQQQQEQQQQYQMQPYHNQPLQLQQYSQQQQQQAAERTQISLPHLYYAQPPQEHFMQPQQKQHQQQSLIHPSQFQISSSYSQQSIPVQWHENSNSGLIRARQLGVSQVSSDGVNDGVSSVQHSEDNEQQTSINN